MKKVDGLFFFAHQHFPEGKFCLVKVGEVCKRQSAGRGPIRTGVGGGPRGGGFAEGPESKVILLRLRF